MQIKGLHKNIYRLYAYARTQECLEVYRQKYLHQVQRWEKLGSEGVSLDLRQEIVGISRATYYRHRKVLHPPLRSLSVLINPGGASHINN